MIRNDYIMRQVELLGQFLARVVFKIDARKFEEVTADLEEASRRFTGLEFDLLTNMPPDQLVDLLKLGGEIDFTKAFAAARILRKEGEIAREFACDDLKTVGHLSTALILFIECFRISDGEFRALCQKEIREILTPLHAYGIPDCVSPHLFTYHRLAGEYALAENTLFNLIESGDRNLIDEGMAFYRDLLGKDDDDLEKGNLPREEVRESLAELQKMPR